MKRLITFLLLFAAIKVAGQTTGYLRFDTVKIMKQNGTCELYIINKTKDTLGILTNVGGGLTQFRKSRVLNDSTIVVGLDTLVIRGSGSVTSISQGYGIVNTPNPITSTGTIRADTSGTNGLVTRTELLDSTDITTQVESPIYVKLRSSWPVPDTLAIDTTIVSTVTGTLDTAINVLTRGIVVVDTIQLIHSGNSVTTYQNNKLIGSKLLYVSIESYPVGFLTRSNSVYMTFNPSTGTITFTNGRLYDDDMIYILYRTGAIFVTDGSGNLIIDSNGNYVIEN